MGKTMFTQNYARAKGPRQGASDPAESKPRKRSGKSSGSIRSAGLVAAVALPAMAITSIIAYHGSPVFQDSVKQSGEAISGVFSSDEEQQAVAIEEQAAPEQFVDSREPGRQVKGPAPRVEVESETVRPPSDVAPTELSSATGIAYHEPQVSSGGSEAVEEAGPVPVYVQRAATQEGAASAKGASGGEKRLPEPQLRKDEKTTAKVEKKLEKELKKSERRATNDSNQELFVAAEGLTLKQAQTVASRVFGGEVERSGLNRNREWYNLSWKGGQRAQPFDVAPREISVAARTLQGRFTKGKSGFVAFLSVSDPNAPEWTGTYLGAVLLTGTPEKPGRVVGATALQAPKGRFTRREARDLDGDGTAELVLEIESHSPGGYVQRDLAIHRYSRAGTQVLFTARTLEDGPGVPTQEARFKDVSFKDANKDGIDEIVVKEGVQSFEVDETLYRTPLEKKIVATRTFKLSKGRYRIASK